MPAPNAISFDKLTRIIGTPRAPLLLDVRSEEDFAADPRLLPGATRVDDQALAALAPQLGGQPSIAVCQAGHRRSQGTAAWLRAEGCASECWRNNSGLTAARTGFFAVPSPCSPIVMFSRFYTRRRVAIAPYPVTPNLASSSASAKAAWVNGFWMTGAEGYVSLTPETPYPEAKTIGTPFLSRASAMGKLFSPARFTSSTAKSGCACSTASSPAFRFAATPATL